MGAGSLEGTAHSTTPRSAPGDFLLLSCLETAGAEGRRSVEARTVNRAHQTPVLLLQREMCITMATVAKDAQSWVPQMGRRLGDHADPVPTPPLPPLSPALAEALIWHSSSSPAMLRQSEELWGMRGRQRLGLRVLQCQSPVDFLQSHGKCWRQPEQGSGQHPGEARCPLRVLESMPGFAAVPKSLA